MPSTKVIEVVAAIHKRVREQAESYETPAALEDWSNDLSKLQSAYNTAYCARNLVGSVPQLPNTLPGLLARWVIAIAQRMLFWYTPQIRYFNEAATATLNRVCSLEDRKLRVFMELADRLENLERETRLLRASSSVASPELPRKSPYTRALVDAKDFYFQLQGRFQSSGPADMSRLEMYRSVIANLAPKLPAGTWLDIGCGRGKWLGLARDAGYESTGVDSNPAAIQQCRDDGFHVTEADALEFLQSTADDSFAVVSALHVLEHWPFEYCLNLVYQAARTLKPGGVFLIETPHAANLLMAAEQFWMDPTHHRPIPLPLMEFLFEYCGIGLIHRFEVNPRAESEHLPFRELELANRLDLLLYGPQDYALMGRRA
jgi:SAM-dependent methyltransferase